MLTIDQTYSKGAWFLFVRSIFKHYVFCSKCLHDVHNSQLLVNLLCNLFCLHVGTTEPIAISIVLICFTAAIKSLSFDIYSLDFWNSMGSHWNMSIFNKNYLWRREYLYRNKCNEWIRYQNLSHIHQIGSCMRSYIERYNSYRGRDIQILYELWKF